MVKSVEGDWCPNVGGRDGGGGTGSSASSEAENVSTNRVGRKWSQMRKK